MVAVLFLGLVAALTLHAQSSTPVSVSPASGSGSEQAFVATYTDPNGATDVQVRIRRESARRAHGSRAARQVKTREAVWQLKVCTLPG